MQLHTAIFNVLVVLQWEVGLRGYRRHVRVLQLHVAVEVVEVVEALLQFPLAMARAHVHHVEDHVFAVDELTLVLRQLNLKDSDKDRLIHTLKVVTVVGSTILFLK